MKKILITGGSGLLGINWGLVASDDYDVTLGLHQRKLSITSVKTASINLESITDLRQDITALSPDIVIHTAGMTSVEDCENNSEMAEYINCELARNVAIVCQEKAIKLIHISTDHLYDGMSANVSESEKVSPINVYGKTKLMGENAVSEVLASSLIVRTNFFGWGGPHKQSFSDWIIYSLRSNKTIKLFDDVFYTPILIDRLIDASMSLIDGGQSGIVNIVGDERISKYSFGEKIIKHFSLSTGLIERASIADAGFLTIRPKDMSLSNQYAQTLLNKRLGCVDEHLLELKHQELIGRPEKISKAFI